MQLQLPDPEWKPPKLDPAHIPPPFRHLIELAKKYGISNDGYRGQLVSTLSDSEREELKRFLREYDEELDSWLAGPESYSDHPTAEYIAFSSLRRAADEANFWYGR